MRAIYGSKTAKVLLICLVFIGSLLLLSNAFAEEPAANKRADKMPWPYTDSNAKADGKYIANEWKYSAKRTTAKQPLYESVPKKGDRDYAAFLSWFQTHGEGVDDTSIALFLETAKDKSKIACRKLDWGKAAKVKSNYTNTSYLVYNSTGNPSPTMNVDTVRSLTPSKHQGADIGYVNECKIVEEGHPHEGEVVYAQRGLCDNPLYANFKLLTDDGTGGDDGAIDTKAYIRRTGEGDDKWVPEPAGGDEESAPLARSLSGSIVGHLIL